MCPVRTDSRLARSLATWWDSASVAELRGTWLSFGRTGLALAELSVLAFSGDNLLFVPTRAAPGGISCGGLAAVSLWCAARPLPATALVARGLAMVVLAAVAVGWRPRWTCGPHWYVAFSMKCALTLPNGGEQVAMIVSMLLVPVCLGDTRRWQWTPPSEPMTDPLRGAALAGLIAIRIQLAIVYFEAALSKLGSAGWRDGAAMRGVLFDPEYGLPSGVRSHADLLLGHPGLIRGLTWAVLVLELSVALTLLSPPPLRRVSFVLVCALHLSIIIAMGLPSFGIVMIAANATAQSFGRNSQEST